MRKNPKLSSTTHNVFGIQGGVGITIAVRSSQNQLRQIQYYRVPEYWRKTEKLSFLAEKKSILGIDWLELQPDVRYTWITNGLHSEFMTFLPVGIKGTKSGRVVDVPSFFKNYGRGVATCRDDWAYDFSLSALTSKIKRFIEVYNGEVDRWHRRSNDTITIDEFVTYDDTKIKWSEGLKFNLQRGQGTDFSTDKIRQSLYRPFCKQWLYFDRLLIERVYQFTHILPILDNERENAVIYLSGVGSNKTFHCLVANVIPDLHFTGDSQCFPYYIYNEDGTTSRENITDWSLTQFQAKYGPTVTKWDIFHYVYAMLHHPQYRERYTENLKRDLPHIPLLHNGSACLRIGRQLMDLHLNYEQAREYSKLEWFESDDVPFSWRVEKMRLSTDRRVVVVNESLRLGPIPPECFEYRLGNRSALEWVLINTR